MSIEPSESSYRKLIGTRVGDYIIDDFLGAGGQAVVYEAHSQFKDQRALKVFGLTSTDMGGPERGLSEAKKAIGIHHQSVITFYDPGTDDIEFEGSVRKVLYIPMQLSTLGNCEDTPPFRNKDLSVLDSVLDYKTMISLLDGLREIHNHDETVHDDIKPANILQFGERLDGEERTVLRITDFGIARVLSAIGHSSNYPSAMTVQYAAPERFFGNHSRKSDIYSMGATLFYMITGKLPISPREDVPDVGLAWRLAHQSSPRPNAIREVASCPPRLALLVIRMMSIEPDERPELDECVKQLRKIINSIEKKGAFSIPTRLEGKLNHGQFPTRYVADFRGVFKPSVHNICETKLSIIRIRMGHIVYSEYKRLIQFLTKRFHDCFCLYETWGKYDINMFMWSKPSEVENLEASLEAEFPGSEVQIHKADRVRHFHNEDNALPENAGPVYALAVQDSIYLPNLDRRVYLCDEFQSVPEDSIRAFTYIEASEHPLRPPVRAAIVSAVHEKMAEIIKPIQSSPPRFLRISTIELSSESNPTILIVEFVVTEYKYLHEVPTAIIGLAHLKVKTSTFIATSRIVIQSNKMLFE